MIYKNLIFNKLKSRGAGAPKHLAARASLEWGKVESWGGERQEGRGKGDFEASGADRAMNSKSDCFQFPAKDMDIFFRWQAAGSHCGGEVFRATH